jgi:hypothetical protein
MSDDFYQVVAPKSTPTKSSKWRPANVLNMPIGDALAWCRIWGAALPIHVRQMPHPKYKISQI